MSGFDPVKDLAELKAALEAEEKAEKAWVASEAQTHQLLQNKERAAKQARWARKYFEAKLLGRWATVARMEFSCDDEEETHDAK